MATTWKTNCLLLGDRSWSSASALGKVAMAVIPPQVPFSGIPADTENAKNKNNPAAAAGRLRCAGDSPDFRPALASPRRVDQARDSRHPPLGAPLDGGCEAPDHRGQLSHEACLLPALHGLPQISRRRDALRFPVLHELKSFYSLVPTRRVGTREYA